MRLSLCHYSYHRTWAAKNWDCTELAIQAKHLVVEGIDFHVRYLASPTEAPAQITTALDKSGLRLSAISLANDFAKSNSNDLLREIQQAVDWIRMAAEVNAPVVRIFGGYIYDKPDKTFRDWQNQVIDSLGRVASEAERLGVMLGLENHGGLPGTAEEQVFMIKQISSEKLRATIDVGNYLKSGQQGHIGTALAAPYAVYVHFKDFAVTPNTSGAGTDICACIPGQGHVNHAACLDALNQSGYSGFVALEYEGPVDEIIAVPQSIEYMKKLIRQ